MECIHDSWRFPPSDLQGADPLAVSGPHVEAPIKYGLSARSIGRKDEHAGEPHCQNNVPLQEFCGVAMLPPTLPSRVTVALTP